MTSAIENSSISPAFTYSRIVAPPPTMRTSLTGGLAGLVECGLDAVVDEMEGGPARPLPGVALLVRHDEDRRVERRRLRPHLLAGVEHALAHHARAGAQMWPEEAPFHTPVFVVTHEKRDPWERPGGTTFHFVNDGIEPALDQAREAAGDRDVRIAGGGATILEYVNAGLIDEFSIALSPVLFGSGIRLFEGVDAGRVALEPVRAEPSPRVTHLTYTVRER